MEQWDMKIEYDHMKNELNQIKAKLRKLVDELEAERLSAVDRNQWYADGVGFAINAVKTMIRG